MAAPVNVSLPDHLHAALVQLLGLDVPENIKQTLLQYVKPTFSESATVLPYELLASISRWAHSDDGKLSLTGHRLGTCAKNCPERKSFLTL
jgi:hypothetical protein